MTEKIFSPEKEKSQRLLETFPYSTQYPDWQKFTEPYEANIYINQGHGGVTLDGTPLKSEGFSYCTAMLLQNADSLEAALVHIDKLDIDYEKQAPVLQSLSTNGKFEVLFIRGSLSRDLKDRILESDGFSKIIKPQRVLDDIEVDTGQQHWGMLYKPKERLLYVDSRKDKKIFIFQI